MMMNAVLTSGGPLALATRRLHHSRLMSAVVLHKNGILMQNNHHSLQITRYMAGHNKWSKIKRKKAANDVARARDHTKATRAIESASRSCQGDMADISLQSAVAAARSVQLPKERIEKAIERGANPNTKDELSVIRRYDGMVPGGSGKVAVIIETLTENKNRTAANVRHLVTKIGGELLNTGANDWLFEHVGVVCVSRNKRPRDEDESANARGEPVQEDELIECALEGGANDVDFGYDEDIGASNKNEVEGIDNPIVIKCGTSDMLKLVLSLQADGYLTTQFDYQWLVRSDDNKVLLSEEGLEKFEKFLDSLDEDLDVTNVYHNATFPEEVS
jgi:YebC/PmpR family DNA-binding regulatory protein